MEVFTQIINQVVRPSLHLTTKFHDGMRKFEQNTNKARVNYATARQ